MDDMREKLVELIISSVGGCSRYWAGVIADGLIAGGVTIQRWIPVTERLPEEGDRYLCRLKSFAFPGSFYQSILRYDKYGFQDGGVYEDGVTQWMPLPQPPKGE